MAAVNSKLWPQRIPLGLVVEVSAVLLWLRLLLKRLWQEALRAVVDAAAVLVVEDEAAGSRGC